ncbi:hypothetical protein Drose_11410 [Dactylosporangium roseum]|uniref:Uncharacterized protein n=1 Tax=Dactylosporangium roseum TaxID=47989 RepID=A0ABY5ZDC0_9ACTN|nr:hypothetical protein [Dactylosporangium roseum]UWZ38772.1 hypothetical protein Drose_11410 [Dactylosporangium roseum]
MGLARDAFRALTLAATAGLAVGGVAGVMNPPSSAPSSSAPPSAAPSSAAGPAPVRVTSVDLLGADRLEVTLRFTNTGRTLARIDAAAVRVTADGVPLRGRTAGAVDLRPGATADRTVAFDAPPAGAGLTLTLPGGGTLPLRL